MGEQTAGKLNQLNKELPEGLLVDALGWKGGATTARFVKSMSILAGWSNRPIESIAVRVAPLRWEHVVISLQTLLEVPVVLGGRTALELQGYAHYLAHEQSEVHLYGQEQPPTWLHKLPLAVRFVFHKSRKLFRNDPVTRGLTSLSWNVRNDDHVTYRTAARRRPDHPALGPLGLAIDPVHT